MAITEGELGSNLARLTENCRSIGAELAEAASRLIQLQSFPSSELIERLEGLRREWSSLIESASQAQALEGKEPSSPPDLSAPLAEVITFVEEVIAELQRNAERDINRASVLGLLAKVISLEPREGQTVEGLSRLRAEASQLARQIGETSDPGSLEDFASIVDGSHGYCHLLSLVENPNGPDEARIEHLIECTASFGRETARAAQRGMIVLAPPGSRETPATQGPETVNPPPGESTTEEASEVAAQGPAETEPPPLVPTSRDVTPGTGSVRMVQTRAGGPTASSPSRSSLLRRMEPTILPLKGVLGPIPHPDPKIAAIEATLGQSRTGQALPITIVPPAREEAAEVGAIQAVTGAGEVSSPSQPVGTGCDGFEEVQTPTAPEAGHGPPVAISHEPLMITTGQLDRQPSRRDRASADKIDPGLQVTLADSSAAGGRSRDSHRTGEMVADGAIKAHLATREEILEYCTKGDYLGAGLLAAGRVFDGLPEVDPYVEVLLVAHHVCCGSEIAPWPDWCSDPDTAAEICGRAPESARLALLAALCQISRSGTGNDPLAEPVKDELIVAFNDLPDVRSWLADVLEAISIPGLWEQVRRHEVPSAFEAYQEAYGAFLKRYENGLLHRNPNAAYGHRLDHYLSRLPASRMLHDYLKPNGPGSLTSDTARGIRDLLEGRAEAVTNDWLKTTERATGGGIKLNGNQRTDLVRRAANYLESVRRVWRASEALQRLQRSGPQAGDVARRRERFLAGLSGVRERAVGTPWGALFERLMKGLLP